MLQSYALDWLQNPRYFLNKSASILKKKKKKKILCNKTTGGLLQGEEDPFLYFGRCEIISRFDMTSPQCPLVLTPLKLQHSDIFSI